MSSVNYGVILKYSDSSAPSPGTIEIHKGLIRSFGYTWLGKFGKITGKSIYSTLNEQLKNNIPTYIFLLNKAYTIKHNTIHCCNVTDITYQRSNVDVYPDYYPKSIKSWFKITSISQLNSEVLNRFYGRASRIPITSTMYRSMSPLITIYYDQNLSFEDYLQQE